MSGHSFGAVTTQAVSGETYALAGQRFTDPRIDAAILFSPSSPKRGSPADAFAGVKIPWLLMTGTLDQAPIGDSVARAPRRLSGAAARQQVRAGAGWRPALCVHRPAVAGRRGRAQPESSPRDPRDQHGVLGRLPERRSGGARMARRRRSAPGARAAGSLAAQIAGLRDEFGDPATKRGCGPSNSSAIARSKQRERSARQRRPVECRSRVSIVACRSSLAIGRFVAVPESEYKSGDGGPSHATVESCSPARNPGFRVRRRPRGGSRGALRGGHRNGQRRLGRPRYRVHLHGFHVALLVRRDRGQGAVRDEAARRPARLQGDVVRLHQHVGPRNHAARPGARRAAAGGHARSAGAAREGPLQAGTRGAGRWQAGRDRRRGRSRNSLPPGAT